MAAAFDPLHLETFVVLSLRNRGSEVPSCVPGIVRGSSSPSKPERLVSLKASQHLGGMDREESRVLDKV